MRHGWTAAVLGVTLAALPAAGWTQQTQNVPGLGGGVPGLGRVPGLGAPETPEQKRAFCQRVATAAARCAALGGLSLDMAALTACLVRGLPPEDSLRVAQVANSARGSAGALLSECGIGIGR